MSNDFEKGDRVFIVKRPTISEEPLYFESCFWVSNMTKLLYTEAEITQVGKYWCTINNRIEFWPKSAFVKIPKNIEKKDLKNFDNLIKL